MDINYILIYIILLIILVPWLEHLAYKAKYKDRLYIYLLYFSPMALTLFLLDRGYINIAKNPIIFGLLLSSCLFIPTISMIMQAQKWESGFGMGYFFPFLSSRKEERTDVVFAGWIFLFISLLMMFSVFIFYQYEINIIVYVPISFFLFWIIMNLFFRKKILSKK